MLKRIIMLLSTLCLLFLSGCHAVKPPLIFDNYSILLENEKWYFVTDSIEKPAYPADPAPNSYDHTALSYHTPRFSSLKEMHDKFTTGSLDAELLSSLVTYYCDDSGMWEICDLNHLFDCQLPGDVTAESVLLYGTTYSWTLKSEIFTNGTMMFCTQEEYDKHFDHYSGDQNGNPPGAITIHAKEQISDRNATEYHYSNNIGEFKLLKYQIKLRDKSLYITEKYQLSLPGGNTETDIVPRTLEISIEENGVLAHIWLDGLCQRPTIQWITFFGLNPF